MTMTSLYIPFRSLKKSDKVAIWKAARKTPAQFRKELLGFLKSPEATELAQANEGYRIERLGEFVGESIPEDRVKKLISEARSVIDDENAKSLLSGVLEFFLVGVLVGIKTRSTLEKRGAASPYRVSIVLPDQKVSDESPSP